MNRLLVLEVVELLGLSSTLALAIPKQFWCKKELICTKHFALILIYTISPSVLVKLLRVTWCLCLGPTEPEQLEISMQLSLFCLSASERHDSKLTSANPGSAVPLHFLSPTLTSHV